MSRVNTTSPHSEFRPNKRISKTSHHQKCMIASDAAYRCKREGKLFTFVKNVTPARIEMMQKCSSIWFIDFHTLEVRDE